jgi:hypothetical protein
MGSMMDKIQLQKSKTVYHELGWTKFRCKKAKLSFMSLMVDKIQVQESKTVHHGLDDGQNTVQGKLNYPS